MNLFMSSNSSRMTSVRKSSTSLERGNKQFCDVLCTMCEKEGKNTEAYRYCKDCSDFLCEPCTQNHEIRPMNERHILLDATMFTADKQPLLLSLPTKRCAIHPGELINTFCEQHYVVCCSVCKVLEQSTCSKSQHLPDAAMDIRTNSQHKHVLKEMESFILDVGKLLRDRKTDLSRVKKEKQTAERTIVDFRKKIKDTFDELEKKSLDELNQNTNAKITGIEEHMNYLEITRQNAGDILRQLQLFKGDNESDLYYHVKDGKRLIIDSKEKMVEISEALRKECIRYEIDADIEKYVTSLDALGSISDIRMTNSAAKSSDVCLSAYQPPVDAHITNNTHTDQSKGVYDVYAVSPECSFTSIDQHNAATSDLKPEVYPHTQEAESHHCIRSSDIILTARTSSAISTDASTTPGMCFTLSSNSDIYVNVSGFQPIPADTFQSPENATLERVTSTDIGSTTSSSSVCSDVYTNSDYSSTSSDVYDSLPCHGVISPSTDISTPLPSEVPLSSDIKQSTRSCVNYSPTSVTPTLVEFSDITGRSAKTLKTCIQAESSSTITVSSFDNKHSSSNSAGCILNQSCKYTVTAATNNNRTVHFTEASILRHVSEHSNEKDGDAFTRYRPVPVMRFNVKEKSDHHHCNIFDICQSPDGKIILTDDANQKLKRFDQSQSYKLIDSLRLPGEPYSVCMAGPGMAAVAMRNNKKIQFVQVGRKLVLSKSFRVGNYCRGMVYINGYLNVCTGDISNPHSGRVEVYNNKGQLQYCIPSAPNCLPSILKYIVVTEVGHHRFATMYGNESIAVLDTTENFADAFSHRDLKQPEGICTDGRDQVFVCGFHSNNVVQLSSKHKRMEVILDETYGIEKPIAIHYDGLQSRLLVSCSHSNEVFVFTLKLNSHDIELKNTDQ